MVTIMSLQSSLPSSFTEPSDALGTPTWSLEFALTEIKEVVKSQSSNNEIKESDLNNEAKRFEDIVIHIFGVLCKIRNQYQAQYLARSLSITSVTFQTESNFSALERSVIGKLFSKALKIDLNYLEEEKGAPDHVKMQFTWVKNYHFEKVTILFKKWEENLNTVKKKKKKKKKTKAPSNINSNNNTVPTNEPASEIVGNVLKSNDKLSSIEIVKPDSKSIPSKFSTEIVKADKTIEKINNLLNLLKPTTNHISSLSIHKNDCSEIKTQTEKMKTVQYSDDIPWRKQTPKEISKKVISTKNTFMEYFKATSEEAKSKLALVPLDCSVGNLTYPLDYILFSGDYGSLKFMDPYLKISDYMREGPDGASLMHCLLSGIENRAATSFILSGYFECAKFLIQKNSHFASEPNTFGITPKEFAKQLIKDFESSIEKIKKEGVPPRGTNKYIEVDGEKRYADCYEMGLSRLNEILPLLDLNI